MPEPYRSLLALFCASWMAAAAEPGAPCRMSDAKTRWISPENPTGAAGAGGHSNRGAKGRAFIDVKPGDTVVTKTLTIKGEGTVRFGTSAAGLTPAQLAIVHFETPQGKIVANITADGTLAPR